MIEKTPPVISGGLPVLGHALEMMRDREKLFRRGFKENGDIFTIKLGPQYAAVVSGAENNRLVYTQTDKALNMQEAYAFLKESIGEVLFTADQETYYNQRPVLQEVFRRDRMTNYVKAMNREVQLWLDQLGNSGEMDLTAEMLRLTQYVAGAALIGPNFREELGDQFWLEYGDISRSLDPLLPPNLPLPKFRRRDRAKANIKRIFHQLIDKRRQDPTSYDDLISTLLTTPLKDGTLMDEDTIVSMFTGLLFAGHETTAGQAAWLLTFLLQHPDYLNLVHEELRANFSDQAEVDETVMRSLTHIFWAIDETTRMRPSADLQMRTVTEPLTIGDYQLPTGWRVIVNAANSHFLPDVFSDPYRFDPLRWSPERAEGKNPFAIVGFGGGIHKCTGMNFAKNEMAIITAHLFRQYDLQLISNDIRVVQGNGANHPSKVLVSYCKI
jgi:sterol 14-demethylase